MNILIVIVIAVVYFFLSFWFTELIWQTYQKEDKGGKFVSWLLWPATTLTGETGFFMEGVSEPIYKFFIIFGLGAVKICLNLFIISIELVAVLCAVAIIIVAQIIYTLGIIIIKAVFFTLKTGWIKNLKPFKFVWGYLK